MSGGSFNYLANRINWEHDTTDAIAGPDMMEMIVWLRTNNYTEAAQHLDDARRHLTDAIAHARAETMKLHAVMYCVEWHCSGDWGIDRVDEAIESCRP